MSYSHFNPIDLDSFEKEPDNQKTVKLMGWLINDQLNDKTLVMLANRRGYKRLLRTYILQIKDENQKANLIACALDPLKSLGKFFWVTRSSDPAGINSSNLGYIYSEYKKLASKNKAPHITIFKALMHAPTLEGEEEKLHEATAKDALFNPLYFDELLARNRLVNSNKLYTLLCQADHHPDMIWGKYFLINRSHKDKIFTLIQGYFNVLEYLLDADYSYLIINNFAHAIIAKLRSLPLENYEFPYKCYAAYLNLARKLRDKDESRELQYNYVNLEPQNEGFVDTTFTEKSFVIEGYFLNYTNILNSTLSKMVFNLIASGRVNRGQLLPYKDSVRAYIDTIANIEERQAILKDTLTKNTLLHTYFAWQRGFNETSLSTGNLFKLSLAKQKTETNLAAIKSLRIGEVNSLNSKIAELESQLAALRIINASSILPLNPIDKIKQGEADPNINMQEGEPDHPISEMSFEMAVSPQVKIDQEPFVEMKYSEEQPGSSLVASVNERDAVKPASLSEEKVSLATKKFESPPQNHSPRFHAAPKIKPKSHSKRKKKSARNVPVCV